MIITDGISKIKVKDGYSVSLECKENIFSILIETGDYAVQVGYYKSPDYAVKVLDIIENLLQMDYTNKFDVPLTDMEDGFIVTDGDETIICENMCNLRVEDDYLVVENSIGGQRFGPLDYAHDMWQECCQAKARGEKFFIITDTLRSRKSKKESKFIRIQGAWIRVPDTGFKTRIEHEEDAWYIYLDFKDMDLKVSSGYSSKEMAEIACDYLKDDAAQPLVNPRRGEFQQIMVLPPEKLLTKKKLRCEIIECKKGYFFLSVFVIHKGKRINIAKLGQYKTLEHAQAAKEILDKKFNSKLTV